MNRSVAWPSWLATAAMSVAVLAAALAVTARILDVRLLNVQSGSMRPAIAPGDLIVARPAPATRPGVGDIVTFDDPSRPGRLLTHRVTAVHRDGDRLTYHTRGDANAIDEQWATPSDGVVLTTVAIIPHLGIVARMSRHRGAVAVFNAILVAAVVWAVGRGGSRRRGRTDQLQRSIADRGSRASS